MTESGDPQAPHSSIEEAASRTRTSVEIAILDERWEEVAGLRDLAECSARCAVAVGLAEMPDAELSLAFSNDEHICHLNAEYRGKPSATNVLSFPADQPGEAASGREFLLGDVVLAFETINTEARTQGKTFENHLCHLIVHGVLHLLGYDHERESDAQRMEACEVAALGLAGVRNPYELNDCDCTSGVNPPAS